MIPLAHIHPMLVHFPIVFFLSLAAFDVIAALRGANVTGRSVAGTISFVLALLAGLSAIAAYVFGAIALDTAEAGGFHSNVAEIHEGLGGMTAAVFVIWALVRAFVYWRNIRLSGKAAAAAPIIEIAGVVLVVATAYFGGKLVFDLGVNVAHVGAALGAS
jgi:uncharacterized membrane protein